MGADGYDDEPLLSDGGMLLLLVVVGIVSVVVGVGVGVEVGGGVVGSGRDVGVGGGFGGGGGAGSSVLLGSSLVSEEVVRSGKLDEVGSGGGTAGDSDDETGIDSSVEVDVVEIGSSVVTGNRVADSLLGVWVP